MEYLFSIFICSFILTFAAQGQGTPEKLIPLDYDGTAKLHNKSMGGVFDSLLIKDGVGTYRYKGETGKIANLYLTEIDPHFVHYAVMEEGEITVTVTRDSLIILGGTPNNEAFGRLDRQMEPLRFALKGLNRKVKQAKAEGDGERADALRSRIESVAADYLAVQKEFALENDNLAGLNYIRKLARKFSVPELSQLLESYSAHADHPVYRQIERIYASAVRTNIGTKAPDFTLPTPDRDSLSLTSLHGEIVVIDFWASWCKPCRAENPHLRAMYRALNEKGLEILSVSTDDDEEAWMEAIKEDRMSWRHVVDDRDRVAGVYGVNSLPRTFILDRQGTIVAKDLRGDDLERKVRDLLDSGKTDTSQSR